MLQLNGITKRYGEKTVLEEVEFCFNKTNTIYTILGESGSGKTTLFNILYGVDQHYKGNYIFNNKQAANFKNSDWDYIRKNEIGIVFQDYKLLENLTVYDNLYFSCFIDQNSKNSRIEEVLDLMNLNNVSELKASKLSGGQKQRLAIARAIINNPKVLLLDEPTGNLDAQNTDNVMSYLAKIKKDCMIIIITHDQRVKEYSDVTLQLINHKLELIEDHNSGLLITKDSTLSIRPKQKQNFSRHFLCSLNSRRKDIILNNMPVCIILCIFICIFSFVNLKYNEQLNVLFNGFSDRAIYISSSNYSQTYLDEQKKDGLFKIDDGTRINFSSHDLESVKHIDHVEKATLYNSSTISLYDYEHSKLHLVWNKEDLPNPIKKMPSYSSSPNNIDFSFKSMNIPYEYSHEYNNVPLLWGDYPKNESNEIVIPDLLAYEYFQDISSAIGKDITLNTYKNSSDFIDKQYKIVGIYKTDVEKSIDNKYSIYVNYMQDDFLELFLSEEQYQNMRQMDFENNNTINGYKNPIFESYENYVDAIGTNLGDLIIVVDDSENVKVVQEDLAKLFPNLKILSQYELKYGDTSLAYKQIERYIQLGTLAVSLVLGGIIILLNKNYIKTRNREIAILYALGYSKKYTAALIVLENIFTMIVNMAASYSILKLLQILYFKNSTNYLLFQSIFTFKQIGQIIIYVFIMTLLATIFSLFGINKKKLHHYLEGDK